MSQRRRAREVALQILFEDDVNPRASVAELEDFLRARLASEPMRDFARQLILGVRQNLQAIDARLAATADNWSVERMAGADRNLLRLATYEILHTDTPLPVAINEAIELAKRFGSAQSGAFVNGILDRFKDEGDVGMAAGENRE